MKKQKIISAILIMTMLFAAAYPLGVGALGSNPTRLDISVGSITITPDGASGGGLEEAETALNPDGYVITGNSETNTVTVQDGVTTEIELDGVNISNSAAGSSSNVAAPLSVLGSSKVSIKLSGVNSLTGSGQWSQGIALGTGADLYIDGSGELNVSGWVSGIGGKNSTTVRKGIIEINGGVIMASGTRGAGIGGAGGRNSGEIIINGGTVTAVSGYSTSSGLAAGIGDGVAPSLKRTNPVIINGGSVNSTIQGTPENENGEELRLITASVSGGADKTFTLTSADGGENTAKADAEGKLYLYIPKTADFVSVMDGSTMHYAQELAQDVDLEVDFEQYSGAPCSCDAGGGSIVFNGGDITVNTSIGEQTVILAASFKPAEACQYPVHALSNIEYRLAADVTGSEAKINGKELTVYSEAAGKDIGAIATATVNGKEYSKSTAFHVTEDDSYAVDLAGGDIVISEISVTEGGSTVTKTHVTVGDTVYDFEDQSRPIRIFQSDSAPNNTIQIDRTVKGADIIFDNLTIAKTARTPGYCVNVLGGAEVAITLSGDNEVIQNTELAYAAFFIGVGSTVTIKGEGSLYVKGGYANVAIGAPNYNSMGTLVIESGKITAVGGEKSDESANDAAPAIGVPVNGNMGGRLVLKGGFLDAHSADKSDRGDINAAVVIDGGSLVSPVEIYNTSYSKYIPKNSSGSDVYLTELTLEDVSGAADIVYYVTEGSKEESAAISSALDENGKLYLYLPEDGVYRRIRAQLKGDSSTDYFKRMKASADTEENTGVLVKNPQGSIKTFYIVGQSNCVIDEESKTITVSVPSLTDLTSCKPSIDAGGLEYSPSGAVNLQDNDEMIYSVILDNGESVEYTVKIDRVASSENDMTVLDIGVGDIVMSDNQGTIEITIGDVKIVPNPNGYIITGKTDANIIFIEKAGAPVVLRNLVIDRPVLSDFDVAPMTIVGSDVDIAIEGVNEISGNTENSALHLFDESGLSISGSGILTLRGGAGAGGVTADSQNHRFEIGDASVFIIDGENSEESQANPVNEAGEPLYPLIVTIADEGAANSELVYSDTRYNDEGEVTGTTQNVKMLSDGSARLSLYKSAGNYLVSVLWNGDVYYSEDRVSVSALSTPKDPVSVTLTIPSIKGLSFKDPQSSLEKKVAVILSGTNLGGDMVVTATGEKGEKVSASAAKKGDVWQAELTIPANKSVTGVYRWTLSARIGDVEQELSETYYIDMWRKLAITTFSLGEGKQVGEAQIDHDEELVTVIVPYDVDLRTTNFRPQYEHTGDVLIGNWGGTTMNLLNPATASIAYERGAGDRTEYTIRAQKQETPVINEISFEQPADYNGGNVVITMTGENLDNLANASTDAAKRIVVSAAGRDVYVTRPIPDGSGGTIWQATVPVPDNATGAQTVRYPITITINGLEQTFTGEHEIIVPARIEALANITDFVFNDAEGNPIEAVSLEITDGTAGSVSGGTSGTPGKIAIVLPSGTNIAETGLIPSVTLENPKASLRITDAEGKEYGAGDAIIFTETNVPVTLTVVSEDGENTMSYELEVTVQTRRKSSGKSKNESVTPGSVTFEAYAGGYEDSTFRPDNVITRAEAAALLARLDDRFDETVPYAAYDKNFLDVTSGSWYAKYVGYLAGEGVITGYEDGSFCPNNQISRMEFAALLSRFAESTGIDLKDIEKELASGNAGAGSTSDTANAASSAVKNLAFNALTASAAVSDTAALASADLVSEPAVPLSDISGLWGEEHILGLADAGVVNGYEDGTFRPDGQTTRAETVTMLNRMLGRIMTDELKAAISNAENPFSDLSNEHWAYCDIMSAVHDYTVKTSVIGRKTTVTVELK